ncbi:MAG: DMT family transporter [Pseudomonadota bacterium]
MNSTPLIVLSLIMVTAGVGIPVMAALNGGLGSRLDNPVQAATVLFALALTLSIVVLLFQSKPIVLNVQAIPPQYFFGGFFVAFYILSVTFIAPLIGVGNAIVLVLLGQTLASALIDHFGWFGAQQTPLTATRAFGLVIILTGISITRRATGAL